MTGRWPALVAAGLVALGVGAAADTADIRVTPVVAAGRVTASFAAPASFSDDARAVAQSGLLLTFTFTVELKRPSSIWFDRTLSAVTVASTAKFDNLTGVYQVSKLQDGRVVWSDRTQDDAQVRDWMTGFASVAFTPDERLEPNAEYYVRVRMQSTPRRTFSFWPLFGGGDDGSGRADFTFTP